MASPAHPGGPRPNVTQDIMGDWGQTSPIVGIRTPDTLFSAWITDPDSVNCHAPFWILLNQAGIYDAMSFLSMFTTWDCEDLARVLTYEVCLENKGSLLNLMVLAQYGRDFVDPNRPDDLFMNFEPRLYNDTFFKYYKRYKEIMTKFLLAEETQRTSYPTSTNEFGAHATPSTTGPHATPSTTYLPNDTPELPTQTTHSTKPNRGLFDDASCGNMSISAAPAIYNVESSGVSKQPNRFTVPQSPGATILRGLRPHPNPNLEYLMNSGNYRAPVGPVKVRTPLNYRVTWNGKRNKFEQFKNAISAHLLQTQTYYMCMPEFVKAYKTKGCGCLNMFPHLGISEQQLAMDANSFFGALLGACNESNAAKKVLCNYSEELDGILAWQDLLNAYDNPQTKLLEEEKAEAVVQGVYTKAYPGGLSQFVDDYETAFATLALTDPAWASDTNKKKRLMRNLYCEDTQYLHAMLNNPGYDYVATCQYLHDEAGRSDRLNTNESIKHANNVVASLGHTGGEALLTVLNTMKQYPRAEGSMKINNIIWRLMDAEMRATFIRLRKQAEEVIRERSGNSAPTPTTVPAPTTVPTQDMHNNGGIPAQYPRTAQTVTIEELPDEADDEMIQEMISALSNEQSLRHGFISTSNRSITTNLDFIDRVINNLHKNKPVNVCVSDNGADTTVLGEGWLIEAETHRYANLVGFDAKARKNGLPIVSALTVIDVEGQPILIRAHEAVYNKGSRTTLLSEFQMREHGCNVDSTLRRHNPSSTQSLTPPEGTPIPYRMRACLMTFLHRLPTKDELDTLTPFDITTDSTWSPHEHFEDDKLVIPGMTIYDNVYTAQHLAANTVPAMKDDTPGITPTADIGTQATPPNTQDNTRLIVDMTVIHQASAKLEATHGAFLSLDDLSLGKSLSTSTAENPPDNFMTVPLSPTASSQPHAATFRGTNNVLYPFDPTDALFISWTCIPPIPLRRTHGIPKPLRYR